ncbi:alpha-fucosidase A [Elsinoe australis]|uniref:Alpha-fucosidase A n=1 Tax=Elsinoe australis TaxID=40998 RepID=A0A4U7BFY1_9PEZI|nr:alpha-fucosidase A [Elsinoe australis]
MGQLAVLLLSLACATEGRTLWSSKPASNWTDLIRTAYPVGNGKLGLLPYGEPGKEKLNLNKDDLWSGGPFEDPDYRGANPIESKADALPGIQSWIFQNGSGNASVLQNNYTAYGSYAVLGNVSVLIDGVADYTSYNRSLDLTSGLHTTTFATGNASYTTQVFCSAPDAVCIYDISSTSILPAVSISFEDVMRGANLSTPACSVDDATASIRGKTQADIGMTFFAAARPLGDVSSSSCSGNGVLTIPSDSSRKRVTFVINAGTDYDQTKGNAASQYSFRGVDPEPAVLEALTAASSKDAEALLDDHVTDFKSLMEGFSIELPDSAGSAGLEVSEQLSRYTLESGDPYVEAQQFEYGRYLFVSSSRTGSLPPNLQGKWAYGLTNAWSADYHVDINLQMNHWGVEETGLSSLQEPLWSHMIDTWTPRGSETANLTYGGEGWVVHGWLNTFGFTGLPSGDDIWTLLTSSNAWMMLHVADHFEFTHDTVWLTTTAYPTLLKPVAQFWLSQLVPDQHFNDSTLVVNPCVSPEIGPTTFACSHHQQLLHQLFTNILRLAPHALDTDTAFLSRVSASLSQLDKGLHIGRWNQIQEWKTDIDVQNNTHRHLSHLIGWYPGASLASYADAYTDPALQASIRTTLQSRGQGIEDANAGWEKVWRAACWARLNDSTTAYEQLKLVTRNNFADNLLSMYSGRNEPFQIDANFGYVGAVVAMLVVDLPTKETGYETGARGRTVVLGPAIPEAWGGGSVKGLRLRGGSVVDLGWDGEGVVGRVEVVKEGSERVRIVNVKGEVLYE